MTDTFREVEIPLLRLTKPYRSRLEAQWERLDDKIAPLEEQHDQIYEKHLPKLEALEAKIPEYEGTPTLVEWLTRRAAQIALTVAIFTRDIEAEQLHTKLCELIAERDQIEVRMGQVDDVAEDGYPVAAGNEDQLAIWTLQAQESALLLATAETTYRYARLRLVHANKAQREIEKALTQAKREEAKNAEKPR